MRPRDVQMIPARLRRKTAAPVGRDPIPKTRSLAHEPPVRVLPLPLGLPLALYESSRHLPPFGRQVSGYRLQLVGLDTCLGERSYWQFLMEHVKTNREARTCLREA